MPDLDRAQRLRAVDARVVLDAAVVLDRPHRGDEHDRARLSGSPKRQTMSKNFSIPMSEPKPDSVTT